jgi:gliding motility-associated-like protein
MKLNLATVVFGSILSCSVQAQVQCAIDIQILEGTTIEMCADAPLPISGLGGFLSYDWTGPETVSGQSITPNFSGQYILSALDGASCTSLDTIDVVINANPNDAILSSEGNPFCPGIGTTLSLSGIYSTYLWGAGETTPTIAAATEGTYNVAFIDAKGCDGVASIDLTEHDFALTSDMTAVCTGGAATLEASGGTSYLWTTGETDSTIMVSPAVTTVYSVTISQGSCSVTFSQSIGTVEIPESETSTVIYVAPNDLVYLNGPDDFESYFWYPDNQINHTTTQGVTFSGTESQYILLESTHAGGCVLIDTFQVIVVELTIPSGFSPNDDNINDEFFIPELADMDGAVSVWNRWGDQVLDVDHYENNWSGTCETSSCLGTRNLPEGTYFYRIDVHGVTFKGYLTLKR